MSRNLRRAALAAAVATGIATAALVAVSRSAVPAARESPDAFQLYVVGGSSGMSVPYDPLSFGHMVRHQLGERLLDRPIEVHVLAQSGESSYAQAVRLMAVAATRDPSVPGAALIYLGHNDRITPGDTSGPRPPGAWWSRLRFARQVEFAWRLRTHRAPAYGLDRFAYFLGQMIRAARTGGLTPIVGTIAGNETGVAPSDAGPLPESAHAAVRAALEGPPESCIDGVSAALAGSMEPDAALRHFLNARCLERAGRPVDAREEYLSAIDTDRRASFGRATRSQNAVIRRVAAEEGALLADVVARFGAIAPPEGVGWELMSDGHHANLRGYFEIAGAFAAALAESVGSSYAPEFATTDEYVAAHPLPRSTVDADIWSASWLLSVSVRNGWPAPALHGVESALRRVAASRPEDFTAWFGIAIAQAGREGLLIDLSESELRAWGFAYSRCFDLPADRLPGTLDALAEYGAEPAVLDRMRETFPPECDDTW